MTPPVALTIAGSDSGGGAGIQADLKTFAAHGVFGTTAITALTAQNTRGVHGVHPVPPAVVVAQIEAVLDDLPVTAVKTGMLATGDIVRAVAELAAAGRLPALVVDPVMVATSGDRLLDRAAVRTYVTELLPQAVVLTPNVREAEVLLDGVIRTLADQREAARALGALGPATVVVKGGHAVDDVPGEAVDLVWDGRTMRELRGPRIETRNDHGTGCTFAAATAAGLAAGRSVPEAVEAAKRYVAAALAAGAGWRLGGGHGPLDHSALSPPPPPRPADATTRPRATPRRTR